MSKKVLMSLGFGLTAVLVFCGSASATIIADFNDDLQSPTPATGWAYMYNGANKAVGDSSGYIPLVWASGNGYYRNVATYPSGWNNPGANVGVKANYVSTALGASESWGGESPRLDHYVILAYTIQAGEEGIISIVNSTASVNTMPDYHSGVDMDLKVYVNNTLKYSVDTFLKFVNGESDNVLTTTFDVALGELSVGDTVYVCVGPKGNSYRDYTKTFDFSLDMVPEPATMILLGLGILGFRRSKTR